ncbi:hypothetical protein FCL47_08770 [Desulfopila sp. IMCC35006]|uniref:hypothetical protein n=1 Tax=Desulfopila sp. IMCC35006 TaxID=2569542 RepID=UPI0010AC9C37|nr:hypothetical protein [Desulfopila sp. IMCC35006]TKB26496.1 hypothetical protein FCL47_08770 [Desulfopila sp. IMCC35006]
MKPLNSNCIGIDLTQSVPHVAVSSGPAEAESSIPASSPPAALLPVLRGESIIVGPAAHRHRRGVGDLWPPESQVPVNDDYENGTGRVPLVCAWTKLASLSSHGFSGILGDTDISWNPTGHRRLSSSAEKLIAASIQVWEQKYSAQRTVAVIPDSLGEAAQQALVDNCGSFLIPRPIAVAMSWCRKNADRFLNEDIKSAKGIPLGHLLVITMAFDRWEVVPIEIRGMLYKEKIWLVPVRSRVAGGGEFPRLGVNFCLAMASRKISLQYIWGSVFGGTSSSDIEGRKSESKDQYSGVRACIKDGFPPTSRSLFGGLDGWKEIFSSTPILLPEDFKNLLLKNYKNQLSKIPGNAQQRCLGVVVDGSSTNIPVAENRSLGEFVLSKFMEDRETSISNGEEAAKGAAITAYALEHNLPSYLETIIPIDIHYHGKNAKGDYENAYKRLVAGKTVRAGKEYKSKEPVRGLNITQGEKKLTLTLRRSEGKETFFFRRVTAEIPKQTTIDEEVKIVAHLKPGQGFARVFIDSVNTGVFSSRLDWRTMEECEEPAPPPLAYLPEVSRVVHEEYMWRDAQFYVEDAIRELQLGRGKDLIDAMREVREPGKFNQWPMADSYDEFRGRPPQGDIFRHYGVCPSDGDIDSVSDPSLMKLFANECAIRFVSDKTTLAERKQIQQTASWMYLACPPVIINHARKNLHRTLAQISQEDLHTIGLCFCKADDMALFFKALEQRLKQGTQGVNNWLRACRNIVRFRDSALHSDVIPNNRLDTIVNRVLKILDGQVEANNFSTIFNNCILTCLYLLKRRRYDPGFLSKENDPHDTYRRIEDVLEVLKKKQSRNLNDKQNKIIDTTLKFLRKKGSKKDLDGSVLTG